jgi:hypothetical protein
LNRPDDAEELADTLRPLLDFGRRNQLGAAARQLTPSLGQEHQFQRLEALYFGLLSAKARPA